MEVKKLSENKTALPRTEVTFEVRYEAVTPSRLELLDELSKKLKSKKELTVIKKVNNHYGSKVSEVEVLVYDDEKTMKALETKVLLDKHQEKKEEENE